MKMQRSNRFFSLTKERHFRATTGSRFRVRFGNRGSTSRQSSAASGFLISWHHHLNPDLSKEKWSHEDNIKLFQLHRELGSHWKEIAARFSKRTDNGIKNQFFSIIRKSLRKACKYCQLAIPPSAINSIKPRILSEFLNSDLSVEGEHANSHRPAIKISELVHRFAFNKTQEMDSDMKRLFRDALEKNFQKLENLNNNYVEDKTKKKISKEKTQKRKKSNGKKRGEEKGFGSFGDNHSGNSAFPRNPISLTNTIVSKNNSQKVHVRLTGGSGAQASSFENDWRQYLATAGKGDLFGDGREEETRDSRFLELIDHQLELTQRIQSQIEKANPERFDKMKKFMAAEDERLGRGRFDNSNLFETIVSSYNPGPSQTQPDARTDPEAPRVAFQSLSPTRFPQEPAASLGNTFLNPATDRKESNLFGSIAGNGCGDGDLQFNRGFSELNFDLLNKSRATSGFFFPLGQQHEVIEEERKVSGQKEPTVN